MSSTHCHQRLHPALLVLLTCMPCAHTTEHAVCPHATAPAHTAACTQLDMTTTQAPHKHSGICNNECCCCCCSASPAPVPAAAPACPWHPAQQADQAAPVDSSAAQHSTACHSMSARPAKCLRHSETPPRTKVTHSLSLSSLTNKNTNSHAYSYTLHTPTCSASPFSLSSLTHNNHSHTLQTPMGSTTPKLKCVCVCVGGCQVLLFTCSAKYSHLQCQELSPAVPGRSPCPCPACRRR